MKLNRRIIEDCFKDAIHTALETGLFKPDVLDVVKRRTRITVVPPRGIKCFGGRTSPDGRKIQIYETVPKRFRDFVLNYAQCITDHEVLGHAYFLTINPYHDVCVNLPDKNSPMYERYRKGLNRFLTKVSKQIEKLAYVESERRAYYVQYLLTKFRIQRGLWSTLPIDSPAYRIIEETKGTKYDFQDLINRDVKDLERIVVYVNIEDVEDLERIVMYTKWE